MLKATQLCGLLIALCVLGTAQATPHSNSPAKHSSVSHSNSFGSFNTNSNKASVDSATSSGNSFGAFGSTNKSTAAPNATKSSSALSNNLEQHQAQQNALNNFDARNPARSATNSAGTATSGTAATQSIPTSAIQQPVINQTVIVHDRGSSGWGSGWMWFWLGESSARHSNNTVYVNGANQPANQNTATDGATGNTTIITQQPAAQQSSTSWLVIVIWLLIGAAVIGLVASHFIHAKQSAKPRNYSL